MRGPSAALAGLLFAAAAQAADNVSTFTLDNGLEAVVIEDHRAPVVVHMLWYKTGAADEPPLKSGVAHYLEHLMFKGTDELESGEFSSIVSRNGGSGNAFTSYDYTGYFQRVAADRLGLMMEMEADRMVDLRPTEDEAATELAVVVEERAQRTDSVPSALFREQQRAALYMNHPYGRPVIGWLHEMETLTLSDALDFYGAHYAPNNAVLIVAGDVEPAEARLLAETHYGGIPANPDLPERTRPTEPPHLAARGVTYVDPRVGQPHLARSYLAPERNPGDQEEAARLSILAALLGGNPATSVLSQKMQFRDKKAIYAGAFYSGTNLDHGSFGFAVVPAPGVSLEEAEEALELAIAEFLEEGVDEDALDRVKRGIEAEMIYARDSLRTQARIYGEALTAGLTVEDVRDWPEILHSVTGEEIVAAAERLLNAGGPVTGYFMSPASGEANQ